MASHRQRRRPLFVGSLLIAAVVGCAEAPPSIPSAAATAREDSLRLGLLSKLEPLLAAVPTDPSCDPSTSECPRVVSASPGYFQGVDQPSPIEIAFSGPVQYISVRGHGAINCIGTLGTLVGYGADGTELSRVVLQLIAPRDCGSDNITFGAQGTLVTTTAISRLVILPMQLTFPVGSLVGRASATYTVTYGAAGPPPPPPPAPAPPPLPPQGGGALPCDLSPELCPQLTGISPRNLQGAAQPEPIELAFTGQATQISVGTVPGTGFLSCLGTFGTLVGYAADGTELGRANLQLVKSSDCGADQTTTFGARATLLTASPVARAVILPMSPLRFRAAQCIPGCPEQDWGAQASYTVTYGVASHTPPSAPGAPGITVAADIVASTDPKVCSAIVLLGMPATTGAVSVVGSRADGLKLTSSYPKGVTTITWKATAADGQTTIATQKVTVFDTEAPRITSVNRSVSPTVPEKGMTTALIDPGVATAKDNCPGVYFFGTRGDGLALSDPYPLGTAGSITWTAVDASGYAGSMQQPIKVLDALSLLTLSAPSSIVEGSGYTISVSAKDGAGRFLTFQLDCGLGYGYTDWYPWSYDRRSACAVQRDQRAEPITVRARARDIKGSEREYSRQVVVKNAKPVVTFAATSATTINVGETVSFQGAFTDAGVDDAPWTWSVSWGDATPGANGTTSVQGDVGQFSHSYAKVGTFGAYLKVVDKDGGTSVVKKITITVVQPAP